MTLTDAELRDRLARRVPPTARLLGMELLEVDQAAGRVRMRFPVRAEFCNPMGTLQGGIIAAMLDDAAATAVIARPGRRLAMPTLEFKVSFLGPARLGAHVLAEGRCVKLGRVVAFAEADLLEEASGRLLARMTVTALPQAIEAAASGRDGPAGPGETPA